MKFTDKLSIDSGPGQIDDSGFLRLNRVKFGRIGIQQYLGRELPSELGFGDDEVVNVFRPPEEVFSADSMITLEGVPVVAEDHDWRTPDDSAGVGSVSGSPMADGEVIVGKLLITDKQAIEKVRTKKLVDISLGYQAKVVKKSGQYHGQDYQAVQTEIRYNHVAMLAPGKGRAGTSIKIEDKHNMPNELITIATDYGDIKVSPDSRDAIKKMMDGCAEVKRERQKVNDSNIALTAKVADYDTLVKERDDLKKQVSKLGGEKDALTAELKDAKSPEKLEAAAKKLADTQAVGKVIMGDKMPTGLGSRDLQKAIAVHYAADMGMKVEGKGDEYLDGVYETAAAHAAKTGDKKKVVVGAKVVTGDSKIKAGDAHPATKNWGYKAPGGDK